MPEPYNPCIFRQPVKPMKSTTLAALLTILFLAGCGQSGPLYVPGDPSSIEPPADQAQDNEERDEEAEGSGSN